MDLTTTECEKHEIINCGSCKAEQIEAAKRTIAALTKQQPGKQHALIGRPGQATLSRQGQVSKVWKAKYGGICPLCDGEIHANYSQVAWFQETEDDPKQVVHADCIVS